MEKKVLIIDDDVTICKLLQKVMDSNGIYSEICNSGKEALELIRNNFYHVILLDISLGDLDGFEILKAIRSRNMDTPVIIVSGNDDDFDILYGLNIGADDYITKPFSPLIVGAKVNAMLRRYQLSQSKNENIIQLGDFKFDISTYRFYHHNKEILLSNKESQLMLLFLQNPHKVFTKEMIFEKVWGVSNIVDDNTIMVYINKLRSKIEIDTKSPKHILTVRGIGYKFLF